MSVSIIALSLFFAFVSAAACVVVAVQGRKAAPVGAENGRPAGGRLRRTVRLERGGGQSGPIAGFDRWLLGLVRDSGRKWDANATVLVAILCGLIAAGSLFLWREDLLPATLGMLVGLCVPALYLGYCRHRRIQSLQEQLAPALEMLARSVRAGQSLDQALLMVGSQSAEPLASEFRMCARQLEWGLSMTSAMRSLVERVQLQDVRIFTTTLAVHRQTGGNIARVLERLAGVVRDRLSYRRQLRVSTGAARASAVLIALIGPAVFLFFYFVRPAYVAGMLESPTGQSLLIAASFLELVGLIWTVRLLKPAY